MNKTLTLIKMLCETVENMTKAINYLWNYTWNAWIELASYKPLVLINFFKRNKLKQYLHIRKNKKNYIPQI